MSVKTETSFVSLEHRVFDVAGIFLLPNRPWLSLYGLRLPCTSSSISQSPIQRKLPQEIMTKLFSRLGPYGLGIASCVCREWNILAQQPQFWYRACLDAFSESDLEENIQFVKQHYSSSWKKMFLERPHLRFDGLYVARNTYLRHGIVEWRKDKTVHLVTYFRYLRFWSDGRFRYCTTPAVPKKSAGYMGSPMHSWKKDKEPSTLTTGRYRLHQGIVECEGTFPKMPHVRFRIQVKLRSTTSGANNRLDVRQIATAQAEDDEENLDNPEDHELQHRRGLSPFSFISWEKINDCVLNRPQDIDYYIV